jgi:polyisoprenoid-binding protein YceI
MNHFPMTLAAVALLAAPLLLLPATAQAADYVIDASHTEVGFKVRHNTISWVKGAFAKVEGSLSWDKNAPEKTSATITIDVASVDTENVKRDKHLRSADFFDVENFPTATFTSTEVKMVGTDGSFELVGDFELHGVKKEITLKVEPMAGPVQDPWGNTRIGTTATATIDRKNWGVSWSMLLDNGGLVVGDDVHLTLEVEFIEETKKK